MGNILRRYSLRAVMACLGLVLASALVCHATTDDPYYGDQSKYGYYWYDDPAPNEQEKPKLKPKQKELHPRDEVSEAPKKERRIPSLKDYTAQELWNMYPDDIVELEEDFRKKAVQSPTKENVREHLYMKDLARRKAVAYTSSYLLALQENPDLSLERDMPSAPSAKTIQYKETETERRNKILISRDDFAIIYFSAAGCPYCVEQDKILGYFRGRNNWTIKKIDREQYPDLAAKFNVTMAPTLLLIRKGRDDFMPITSGIISLTELEDRVFMGIRLMNNETTPETYTIRDYQKGGPLDVSGPAKM